MVSWAVVGGGVLGLTVADELRRRGADVTLFEAAPHVGGLASSWRLGDVTWDRHYHVILQQDEATLGMLDRLGLRERVRWASTSTGYYDGSTVHPVSTAADFARLPALGPVDKARIGATLVYGALVRDGERLERLGVERWLRRWSGDRAYERFWRPMLRAKLGDNHRHASAAFIWATIRRLARARRAGVQADRLGYVEGGYATVLDRYLEVLRAAGVDVRLGAPVRSVRRGESAVEVRLDPATQRFDRCVITSAAPIAAQLIGGLCEGERRALEGIRYQGIVCASLLLREQLSPHYLTYITDERSPFTAVVDMSALVDADQLGGHGLVYLPKYVAPGDPLLRAGDDEIRASFVPYLRTIHPQLTDDDVLAFQVSRVSHVLAVATVDFSATVPPVRTSVPGVHLVSSAQIVNGTLNVDESLRLAHAALPELVG